MTVTREGRDAEIGKPSRHLSVADKIGFGIGQVGGQIYRDTPALLLPIYMTTVLAIPPWIAGLAILLPKAWIIICDPLVGAWSDRKRQTWGRSPFLLVGASVASIAFILLFAAPNFPQYWESAAYMSLIFTIASTAFSLFSVPYLCIASEASSNPAERIRLLAYRIVCLAIGVAVGGGYALPLTERFGGGYHGFLYMGLCLAAVCGLTMLTTYFTVRRWPLDEIAPEQERINTGAKASLQVLVANKPFMLITGTYLIALIAQAIAYSVAGLYFIYAAHDVRKIFILNTAAAAVVLISQPTGVALTRYFSKRTLCISGIVGWSAMSLSWLITLPGEATAGELVADGWIVIRGLIWGYANNIYLLMMLSLLTDLINVDLERSGQSRSGLFSGVFSATEKVAFALGPAIAGIILSIFGFAESHAGAAAAQSQDATYAIVLCFTIIPAAINLSSVALFARFKLPKVTG